MFNATIFVTEVIILEKSTVLAKEVYTEKPNPDDFKMHSHSDYEIFCFLKGNVKYFVEGTVYDLKPNDILIIKKEDVHSILMTKPSPYARIVIGFSENNLLPGVNEKIISFINNRPLGKYNRYSASVYKNHEWINYLKKIINADTNEEKQLYLTVVLNELCKEYPKDTGTEQSDNIKEIIEYINSKLYEPINLDEISEKFYLSKAHLIRKFKHYTQYTVWEYVLTKRLTHARELLKNGHKPTTVYSQCGFNDYCTFYKAYKNKFFVSPKDDYKNKGGQS